MIYLASDHAGFELKKQIGEFLKEMNLDFEDVGPHTYDAQDDYPDFIIPAAEKVAEKPLENKGIVLGGSGQGEALAANKVKGVRAALYYGGSTDIITLSRVHNNANVLSLGARFLTMDEIKEVIKLWLATDFTEEERHARRLDKILDYEMKK
ncbi:MULTISPECIES: RpiB/LacA/LacB family sugar-phosphate isomerase [Prolixibacter]|uniref:Ribose 5-phosphate isomerase B n=1 Tax=Prolixibacter denitrificans TaxID=1541063 RepID=A0A2P8CCI9_9BACT|nr:MULTISPECIES: RpiB/LacA/LacB family sugar-phosphate isomerase [Prolixibacter]PSK82639.1 ribose 5-phosphate isomerase B [Prolixibacter denitrificans]GET21537.1 ribose-5-phosphate isomerase [Prolixibacter denitrificans]GET24153.1 ribose-5-phosphate isomerase [Prolixibacter sp. NT017]